MPDEKKIKEDKLKDEKNTKEVNESEKSCEEKCKDFEDKYFRALADYQNLIKQTTKERQDFARYASEQLILEMLPVYDNLKTSLNHLSEEAKNNGWAKGIEYVIKQFADVFKNFGVEEIKTVGEKFDHNTMEAVEKEKTEDEAQDGVVAQEIMAGYMLSGKVIRAARVVVFEHSS